MARLLWILTASLTALLSIASYNLISVFPLKRTVKIVSFLDDTINFHPQVQMLSQVGKTTKEAVLEYLASQYVIARESFSKSKYEMRYKRMLNSSDKNTFMAYYNFISSSDPLSPINLSKANLSTSVTNVRSKYKNGKIAVSFVRKRFDQEGRMVDQSNHVARLGFYASPYDFSASRSGKLEFIVTDYALDR